ncbi:MAG TPA: hypothetical protein VKU19_40995 [Bryobacteraceae bacterium]|nr:hypothetical protein [Bryobacteraceae bacterium]
MIVYREPGLCGLELWRGVSRGVSLFQLRERKQEYFLGLRDFLIRLHHGEAATLDQRETAALRKAAGFTRVILCGGETNSPFVASTFCTSALPFAVEIDRAGPYAARRGALRIFESMNWRHGIALDLGQLQLKVMTAKTSRTVSRDESHFPFGASALAPELGRARLRELLQTGLDRASQSPDGVVLALPVELDCEGVARAATYPGLFGPVEPIFSELFTCPWVVLNDAVLAALSFPPRNGEKTLVVTLGFGIGGALWDR